MTTNPQLQPTRLVTIEYSHQEKPKLHSKEEQKDPIDNTGSLLVYGKMNLSPPEVLLRRSGHTGLSVVF